MSDLLNVLALAVLQGIAEFLPISSSGHLVAAQHFLGFSATGVSLELALHAGTLLSVCVFYFAALRSLVMDALRGVRSAWMYLVAIAVSMVPCGIAYAFAGDWLESHFEDVSFVGPALMATGLLLLTTRRTIAPAVEKSASRPLGIGTAFLMGVGQMVAMLPGVSRSGTTIWVARLCRIAPEEAARFSFLMSVPVIGGACLLEVLSLVSKTASAEPSAATLPLGLLALGALASAVVGYASLALLVRVLHRGRFWMFGVYCLLAGLLLIVF